MNQHRTARRRTPAPRPVWYRRRGVQVTAAVVFGLGLVANIGDDDQEQRPASTPRPAVTVTETATATPTPDPEPSTAPPSSPAPVEDGVDVTVNPDVDRPRKCADKWWC